jgi:hypothetical protein
MPAPTGYVRKVLASENGFNPYAASALSGHAAESRGFCFAMTCRWHKLAMQFGIEGSSRVMDGQELLNISIVQSGYLDLARTFTGASNNRESEDLVYEQSGLHKIWQERGFAGLERAMQTASSQPLHFEIGIPQHSIGWIINGTKSLYYFDPNYGLFEYSLDGVEDLFQHLMSYDIQDPDKDLIITLLAAK